MNAEATAGGALELGVNELLRQRLITPIVAAVPAAGAEFSQAVPAGEVWDLLSVVAQLATSAVVANRVPNLTVNDQNGNAVAVVSSLAIVPASQTFRTAWLESCKAGYTSQGNKQTLPVPLAVLPAGFSIASLTSNIDVGDAYTAIRLMVRQWSIAEVQANTDWLEEALR